jgi:hypothetical protein
MTIDPMSGIAALQQVKRKAGLTHPLMDEIEKQFAR